jgi:hypothetical protein
MFTMCVYESIYETVVVIVELLYVCMCIWMSKHLYKKLSTE